MCRLQIVLSVVCFVISNAEYDYNCIINPLKPASLQNNYMECSNDEQNKEERSTCCDLEGQKVCCRSEIRWGGVRYIAIGVGCTTIILGTVLFIALWCNVVDKPCVITKRKKTKMNKTGNVELEEVVSVTTEKIPAFHKDACAVKHPTNQHEI